MVSCIGCVLINCAATAHDGRSPKAKKKRREDLNRNKNRSRSLPNQQQKKPRREGEASRRPRVSYTDAMANNEPITHDIARQDPKQKLETNYVSYWKSEHDTITIGVNDIRSTDLQHTNNNETGNLFSERMYPCISDCKTEEQVAAKFTETCLVHDNTIDPEDQATFTTCPYKPFEAATFEEVRKACYQTKNQKAPGPDQTQVYAFKIADPAIKNAITHFVSNILYTGYFPA
ncbi:hypothetical protein EVAR_55116_1 [Eumeta japonica]|uniref:Uncharacterized protein n=1 Tax=Eumeta variegata TaxID=151549 RepID=A0A4C1Y8U7_EUMVA|nr:hypothetical protein EVAR_55116_1 [Eumeta japonica]